MNANLSELKQIFVGYFPTWSRYRMTHFGFIVLFFFAHLCEVLLLLKQIRCAFIIRTNSLTNYYKVISTDYLSFGCFANLQGHNLKSVYGFTNLQSHILKSVYGFTHLQYLFLVPVGGFADLRTRFVVPYTGFADLQDLFLLPVNGVADLENLFLVLFSGFADLQGLFVVPVRGFTHL